MTSKFRARIDALSLAQQQLWPELRNAPKFGFALYGGTAITLRLGHRESIDFDFFSERTLDREAIKAAFPFVARSTTLQDLDDTWTVLVPSVNSKGEHIKVSFFGAIAFGRVGEPDFTEDGVLQVASLDDLMATKVKVVLQRAEAKDYRDVAAMIEAGVSLARGLASARILFGPSFQPSESLKALVYFNDGDLNTLTTTEKSTLVGAVKSVRNLPGVTLLSRSLSGMAWDELCATEERLGAIAHLEKQGGIAYTLWRYADAALRSAGADKVDWAMVERKTIIESIAEHGHAPSDVADVICRHSPGAVCQARQHEVLALVQQLAPELQAQYAKGHGEGACEP